MSQLSRDEWLRERKGYLGSTDLAAIVNMHKYKTPLSVWLEKSGKTENEPSSIFALMGLALEDLVADLAAAAHGWTLVKSLVIRHPEHPFIACNPDRLVEGKREAVELKTLDFTTEAEYGEEDSEDIPKAYFVQGIVTLYLLDYEVMHFAAFNRSTGAIKFYKVKRHDDLIEFIIAAGVKFWNENVLGGIEPPFSDSSIDNEYLRKKFPKDNGELVIASTDCDKWASRLQEINKEIAPLKKEKDGLQNLIEAEIGENSGVVTMIGNITFKKSADATVTDWNLLGPALMAEARRMTWLADDEADGFISLYTTTKAGSRRLYVPRERKEK